ncbi:hypothetical protein EI94DRAFT_1815227 [Lactarius quietus]|nr:hypothetical protein EI94DRAFT_1815227 [Lactarius quietus]
MLRSDPAQTAKTQRQRKCLHEHWKNCHDYPEAHTWESRAEEDIEEEEAVRALVAAEDDSYLAYDEACRVRQLGFFIAEQLGARWALPGLPTPYLTYLTSPTVSHHPHIFTFFNALPANNVSIIGDLQPKLKFIGYYDNGIGGPEDEEYVNATSHNDTQDSHADLEFKTKGFFSGTFNVIAGRVRHGSTELGEVSGEWIALMELKSTKLSRPPLTTLPAALTYAP